jgi:hypothetical protein
VLHCDLLPFKQNVFCGLNGELKGNASGDGKMSAQTKENN